MTEELQKFVGGHNQKSTVGVDESFADIWELVESLTCNEQRLRETAFQELESTRILSFSPLIAYLLSTFISDKDLDFRARVIKYLAGLLNDEDVDREISVEVRNTLLNKLSQMRQRDIFSIVEISANYPLLKVHVKTLLEANQFAGKHLIDMVEDNSLPLLIRREALVLISLAGFVDTLPMLEKMESRSENRIEMWAVKEVSGERINNERKLLFSVQDTINILTEL